MELTLQSALDNHNHDLRYQKLAETPAVESVDIEEYPLARFKPLLKLIDENEVSYERKARSPRTRAYRADLALEYWGELRDFCLLTSDGQFALVTARKATLMPACICLATIARALVQIRTAIFLFRFRSTHARQLAESGLLVIYKAFGLLAPVIEFPKLGLVIQL